MMSNKLFAASTAMLMLALAQPAFAQAASSPTVQPASKAAQGHARDGTLHGSAPSAPPGRAAATAG